MNTNKKNGRGASGRPSAFRRLSQSPRLAKFYAIGAVLILLATTVLWAFLGARLHQANADQLVDSYFFENHSTFQGAAFPGQHTFLFKWPLFLLIKMFGFSSTAFAATTIGMVLVTVGVLALILYRIERRPLVFGTICLGLASMLLLVPAAPYAGALLPVNMAMVTSRNLEYVLYIASLYWLVRSARVRSWHFGLAVGLSSLLIASDKLFLALSAGGALLAVVVYALLRRWQWVTLAMRWLVATVGAAVIASLLLAAINAFGLTHIVGESSAGPYKLTGDSHDLILGSVNAVLGFFTNFGANPAFDATTIRTIPAHAFHRLFSLNGLGLVINFVLLAGGLVFCGKVLRSTIKPARKREVPLDNTVRLATLLLFATVAALGVFVATKHYYVVDARYLGLAPFAVFIAAACYTQCKKWDGQKLLFGGLVMVIGVLFGTVAVLGRFQDERAALNTVTERNASIVQAVTQHPVNVLVGDYWRVVPTRFAAGNKLKVMPLADCSMPRTVLNSKAWQPDLTQHSFAYLLSLDRGLTDFPHCSLAQVIAHFGRPNANVLIAGTIENPKELLLFYDHGIPKTRPTKNASLGPTTVLPIDINDLPNPICSSPTVMNIVAHQDDDLLFMSPDLRADIDAGHCVRTVYLTAGDSGYDKFYWLSREQGSEAAYSDMLGGKNSWVQRTVKLADKQYLTILNPKGNPRVSLVFMHLPDGNLRGEGFKVSKYQSLERLEAHKINRIDSVDGQSTYTSQQLIDGLTTLMSVYRPSEIRTQAGVNMSAKYPDHSDHMAVGRYVQRAYQQYEQQQYEGKVLLPLKFYIGYPTHALPENIAGAALEQKIATFLAYAKFDGGVCQNLQQCKTMPTYGSYLGRQYQLPR